MNLTSEISKLMAELYIGKKPVYETPPPGTLRRDLLAAPPVEWVDMNRDDVNRYSLMLRTAMGLLGKVLPDLKAVEIADKPEDVPEWSELELARRIAAALSAPGARPLAGPPPVPADSVSVPVAVPAEMPEWMM